MILPSKHLGISKCLLNSGAIVLKELNMPNTVSSLWEASKKYSDILTFERFILTLSMLYSLDCIEISEGLLRRKTK